MGEVGGCRRWEVSLVKCPDIHDIIVAVHSFAIPVYSAIEVMLVHEILDDLADKPSHVKALD
jgi:hypothetical protein